jgi:hypothetical protein
MEQTELKGSVSLQGKTGRCHPRNWLTLFMSVNERKVIV